MLARVDYILTMTTHSSPVEADSISFRGLSRSSVFWLVMRREDGSLYPMEFKFLKFDRRKNSCEWSRFGTSIQGIQMKSTIAYVEKKAFSSVQEAHQAISRRITLRD
jgi:hypothetical protein